MRIINHKHMYKKILEYTFTKCNVLCVCVRKNNDYNIEKGINIILDKDNVNKQKIIESSEEYLEFLFKELYNDENFFGNLVIKRKRKITFKKKQKIDEEKYYYLKTVLNWIIYNYNTTMWLKKYSERIIYEKECVYGIEYYLKLNNKLKEELLSVESFDDWQFPNSVEGICFYIDNRCWLENIFSWKSVHIYFETEKEYKYLKSIGINFHEKKFTLEKKQPLRYEMINISKF